MVFCILSRNSIENNRKAVINVGIALQLTNILRDVHEDAMADRYFIPKQLLLKYDIQKQVLLESKPDIQTQSLLQYLARLALSKYAETDVITNQILDRKGKVALELSINVYKKILTKLMRNNFVDLSKRVYVTPQEKLLLLVKTFSNLNCKIK